MVVTVALDTNIEAARPFADAANQTHPSLVDPQHRLVEIFGITNIPTGMWIDESGHIVRPGDQAYRAPQPAEAAPPADEDTLRKQEEQARAYRESLTPEGRVALAKLGEVVDRSGRYDDAIRDWVANGASSRYVLSPSQVVERSRPRPPETAMAVAEFEIAQHLQRNGFGLDAVPHFKEAHRLDPRGWTYLRQALAVADPEWGQVYERDMMTEIGVVGADTFYAPLDL